MRAGKPRTIQELRHFTHDILMHEILRLAACCSQRFKPKHGRVTNITIKHKHKIKEIIFKVEERFRRYSKEESYLMLRSDLGKSVFWKELTSRFKISLYVLLMML